MAKVRVFEAAKEHELDVQDLLAALKQMGVKVRSHLSPVEEEEIEQAVAALGKTKPAAEAPKADETKTASASTSVKTNCQRHTDCLCAVSDALLVKNGRSDLFTLCNDARARLLNAPTDPSCDTGLTMYRQTATAAYGIPLPRACR